MKIISSLALLSFFGTSQAANLRGLAKAVPRRLQEVLDFEEVFAERVIAVHQFIGPGISGPEHINLDSIKPDYDTFEFRTTNLIIDEPTLVNGKTNSLDFAAIEARGAGEPTLTLGRTAQISRAFTAAFTHGFKYQDGMKVSVGGEWLGGSVERSLSIELSTSSTETVADTETREISWSVATQCPSGHRCECEALDMTMEGEAILTADVEIGSIPSRAPSHQDNEYNPDGTVNFTFETHGNLKGSSMGFLEDYFKDVDGFRIEDGKVKYQLQGKVTGVDGTQVLIVCNDFPLTDESGNPTIFDNSRSPTKNYTPVSKKCFDSLGNGMECPPGV